jgi:hypothetical protein
MEGGISVPQQRLKAILTAWLFTVNAKKCFVLQFETNDLSTGFQQDQKYSNRPADSFE